MITDINRQATISELNRTKLPSYWIKYFEYEADDELFNLSNNELIKGSRQKEKG